MRWPNIRFFYNSQILFFFITHHKALIFYDISLICYFLSNLDIQKKLITVCYGTPHLIKIKIKKNNSIDFLKIKRMKQRARFFYFFRSLTLTTNFSSKKKNTLNPLTVKKTNHILKSSNLKPTYFSNTFFFLIGGLISPYDWEHENKKKWLKKLMTQEYSFKKEQLNTVFFENKAWVRRYYFNNFHYFGTNEISFDNLNYYIKITNLKIKNIRENFIFSSKPYSIFLSNPGDVSQNNPYILSIQATFKKFQKVNDLLTSRDFSHTNENELEKLLNYSFNDEVWLLKNLTNLHNKKKKKIFVIDRETLPQSLFNKAKTLNFLKNNNFKFYKFYNKHKTYKFFFAENLKKNKPFSFKKNDFNNILMHFFSTSIINLLLTQNNKNPINCALQIKPNCGEFFSINKNKLHFWTSYNPSLIFKKKLSSFLYCQNIKKKTSFFLSYFEDLVYSKIQNPTNWITVETNNDFLLIHSKHNTNLALSSLGFVYSNTWNYLMHFFIFQSYNIKKKYYSFVLKNELQKFMMRQYLKTSVTVFSLLRSEKLKKIEALENLNNEYGESVLNNVSTKNFTKFSLKWPSKFAELIKDNLDDMLKDDNEGFSFFIKKIKFKPGYMTFWREARSVFKEILGLNFKYQYKLTRYLIRFNKILKNKLFLNTEMSLKNILVRSRFFFDWDTVDNFLKNGFVYVNGINTNRATLQLYAGDFIQTSVSLKYYILYRWFMHWIYKKKIKLRLKTKKKLIVSTSEEDKAKTKHFSLWILSYRNVYEDVPKYLEIDFFTMSVFVLYEPFTWQDLNTYSTVWTRFGVVNMYNWKYIN